MIEIRLVIEIRLDEMLAAHEAEQFVARFIEASEVELCGWTEEAGRHRNSDVATRYSNDYWGA